MVNIAMIHHDCWTLREVMIKVQVTRLAIPTNGEISCVYTGGSSDNDNIPENVTKITVDPLVRDIQDGAFRRCSSLQRVVGSVAVQHIRKNSFRTCVSLVQVQLHESLKTIGKDAFRYCFSLVDVELPNGLISMETAAFGSCKSLRTVSIPSTVKVIPRHCFALCSSLVDVDFQEGLESIEEAAFQFCRSLSGIALPSSLRSIELYAFDNCSQLMCVEFPTNAQIDIQAASFRFCKELVNVSLEDSIGRVSPEAFLRCNLSGSNDDVDTVDHLHNRFQSLPVHQACYHSVHTAVDNLESVMNRSQPLHIGLQDDFGMTPFHIVATSATLKEELLECLLDRYPLDVLGIIDKFGKAMMDYLLSHNSTKSVPLVRIVLQKVFADTVLVWHLGSKWTLDLSHRFESVKEAESVAETKHNILHAALEYATYCTRVEMTSILELALWKNKIKGLAKDNPKDDIDRANGRLKCGANVVLENVIGFAWEAGAQEADTARLCFPLLSSLMISLT